MSVGRDKPAVAHYSPRERALYALQERIGGGTYLRDTTLPTERQLAQELGVSRPVIRAALQQLSEEGWIARDPGHRPRVARTLPVESLASGGGSAAAASQEQTAALQVVAVVMPMDLRYPAAYNIQHGIQRSLKRHESAHRLVIFDSLAGAPLANAAGLDADAERQILETIAQEGIAGAILWQIGGQETMSAIDALQEAGVPVVLVDRYPNAPGSRTYDFVGVDNRGGAREAVNHLIHLGHTRIAHLTMLGMNREGATSAVLERYEGYQEALRENGLLSSAEWVGRSEAILSLLENAERDAPTAVFAVNDASAHRFIDLAKAKAIRVPEDVSVIGFDDLDRYSQRSPYLSTMYLPFESVGECAADLLLRRLKRPLAPDESRVHMILSTTLMVRETCTAPKGA